MEKKYKLEVKLMDSFDLTILDPFENSEAIFLSFHKRYDFGNCKDSGIKHEWFTGWNDMKEYLITSKNKTYKDIGEGLGAKVILPVYMYDHSGLALSTYSFSSYWDSGQIGFIFLDEKGMSRFKSKDIAEKYLQSLIENLSLISQGLIYEYNILDEEEIVYGGIGFLSEEEAYKSGEEELNILTSEM